MELWAVVGEGWVEGWAGADWVVEEKEVGWLLGDGAWEWPAEAPVRPVEGAGCTLPLLPLGLSEREDRLRCSDCCVLMVIGGGSFSGCLGGRRRWRREEAASQPD